MCHVMCPVVTFAVSVLLAAFLRCEGKFVVGRTIDICDVVEEIVELELLIGIVHSEGVHIGYS